MKIIGFTQTAQNMQLKKSEHNNNKIAFGHNIPTLTYTNIGSCLNGYIGKVAVRRGSNKEQCFLNVFKQFKENRIENYMIKDDNNQIIGSIDLIVRKLPIDPLTNTDPSHVFVDELRNFSKPNTPYYTQGLEYYKDIGTRLLQIAQRRSDEGCCNGNIKLIAKDESLNWYKNKIGMRQEFPPIPGMRIYINNPNQLYIPPENKEPLSKIQGGL